MAKTKKTSTKSTKKKPTKKIIKPVETEVVMAEPAEVVAPVVVPVEKSTKAESVVVKVTKPEPTPKPITPTRELFVNLKVRHSLTLLYLHEVVCVDIGRCMCKMVDGKREPKSLHLQPGIAYMVPKVLLQHQPLRDRRRKGRVFLQK